MSLSSFFVVPGYTFFYWGFTLKKESYPEFIKYFKLKEGNLIEPITLIINGKRYDAKIRIARINNKGTTKTRSNRLYPERDVVQIFYEQERDTLKALRKLVIYSYATTIDKSKPKLKELLEFIHTGDNTFKVKVVSKQETDFDAMFQFLEDKNLFAFWQDENSNKKSKDKLFVDFSTKWLDKKELNDYKTRSNVIYLLLNSKENQLYVGKANVFGNRVKESSSRVAMNSFDKFMFFELHPDYSFMLDNLETFSIRFLASMFENYLNVDGLNLENLHLVNKQLKNK
tara:strand:- start:42 stop:896 length:855 start_codon:yes stop_codon:yes gene_type:complete